MFEEKKSKKTSNSGLLKAPWLGYENLSIPDTMNCILLKSLKEFMTKAEWVFMN